MSLLEIAGLTKSFGSLVAVDDFALELDSGQSAALWGTNGAGKTTILRCVLGLLSYRGAVRVGGWDAARQGERARSTLGYVPQELCFHKDLSVGETLRFFAELKQVGKEPALQKLARVGLAGCEDRLVGQLSGGMKQRLALALALLGEPPLLLLDEPTSNLDLAAREEFVALLAALRAEGKALLFSSHRPEEVAALADRVLCLKAGATEGVCTGRELLERVDGRARVKLRVNGSSANAVELLVGRGYQASPNGTGIWVEVEPHAKARPILELAQAGILVTDFDI